MPLFDEEEPGRKEELQYLLQQLEQEKMRLFEELAEIAEEQRARVAEIRKIEKGQRTALENIEEHIAEEPLSAEDVEKWARSRFFVFARTAPANPHAYAHRRDCNEEMFEAVVRFIRTNGYHQWYGGAPYICYDVALWSGTWFLWTMGSAVEETIILNAKPDSMRPGAPRRRREAMRTAILHARVSTRAQAEEGYSSHQQIETLLGWLEDEDHEVPVGQLGIEPRRPGRSPDDA